LGERGSYHLYRPKKQGLSSSMKLSKQRSRGRTALEEGAAVLVALGLDILGEPPAPWHPVVWYGKLIQCLARAAPQGRFLQLLYGMVILILAAPVAFLPAAIVHWLAKRVRAEAIQRGCPCRGLILYALVEGTGLKPFFALRMLADAGRLVRLCLERGDLPAARHALQRLVSRDRSELTAELAGAAAIESLAENLSDSIVAPLLYYTLFGLPGAAAYRLFNTFDAMVGYHGQYEYVGKAAARLDDVLNALPSRLTALLIIALAPLFGGNRLKAWQIWRRDARRTASPNAGHPMAAAAGALGLQLEKVGHYRLGDNNKTITTSSVRRAEQMVWSIGCVVVFLTALFKTLWRVQHG
jgi:adenosylcobinamide-phosphate synthase